MTGYKDAPGRVPYDNVRDSDLLLSKFFDTSKPLWSMWAGKKYAALALLEPDDEGGDVIRPAERFAQGVPKGRLVRSRGRCTPLNATFAPLSSDFSSMDKRFPSTTNWTCPRSPKRC